jgi:hypothetical protein
MCLGSQWGRSARALLLERLVRAHVQEEGGAPLPVHAVAAVPLIQDVAGLGQEHDVAQLLRGAAGGMQLVGEDGGDGWMVEVGGKAGADWRDDGLALKIMRWKLIGYVDTRERMMREIGEEHVAELEEGNRWELGV